MDRFEADLAHLKVVHEIFGQTPNAAKMKEHDDLLRHCKATQFTGLLLFAYREDASSPNPSKLRRAMRSLHHAAREYSDLIQIGVWQWSAQAESF